MIPGTRTGAINSAAHLSPEMISKALRRAVTALDAIDDGGDAYISSALHDNSSSREDAQAWMFACLLLIDLCDISSLEVRAIATRVWRGAQDALDI